MCRCRTEWNSVPAIADAAISEAAACSFFCCFFPDDSIFSTWTAMAGLSVLPGGSKQHTCSREGHVNSSSSSSTVPANAISSLNQFRQREPPPSRLFAARPTILFLAFATATATGIGLGL